MVGTMAYSLISEAAENISLLIFITLWYENIFIKFRGW